MFLTILYPTGVFKNAFFAPLGKILGRQNYLVTTNIHDVVVSSKKQCKVACKLLVVLDEAKQGPTKLFQSQIKDTVTTEVDRVSRSREEEYDVSAHHRLAVLSNHTDGLYLDADVGRRFLLLQPTALVRKIDCFN